METRTEYGKWNGLPEAGRFPHDVDVWYCLTDELRPDHRAACLANLSAAERDDLGRHRSGAVKGQFLIGRALVRSALTEYAGLPEDAWRFSATKRGRPFVDHPHSHRHLHFNITLTNGLAAVAISRIGEIGIDAEWIDWQFDFRPIVVSMFAALERREILHSHEDARARFYELWTLKESYIKARGTGLGSIDLSKITFASVDGRISLRRSAECDRDRDQWQFRVSWLRRNLVMSLAIGAPRALQVGCHRWEPASARHENATEQT
jgi:4'-phosphopantetheinyl transferase